MKLATVEVFIPPTLTNTAHHRFPSLQWLTSKLWAATSSRFNSRPSQVEIIYFMKIGFYVVVLQLLSHVCLFATSWTVDHQVPLFMEFPRQEDWSGLPIPPPGDFPDWGIKPGSPALAGRFFTTEPPGKPNHNVIPLQIKYVPSFLQLKIYRNIFGTK